jgi:hypothetical protein
MPLTIAANSGDARGPFNVTISNTVTAAVTGVLPVTQVVGIVLITEIVITSAGNATTITTNGGTFQMSATVLPANATDRTVTWSVISGTGNATINASGLLTAVANGTVTVKPL